MSANDPKRTFSIGLLQSNTGRKSAECPTIEDRRIVPPSVAIIIGPNTTFPGAPGAGMADDDVRDQMSEYAILSATCCQSRDVQFTKQRHAT
jgi:hypothetical protein